MLVFSKIDSIGLAHFPNFTMLVDGENTQREFIKSTTLRLTKTSRFTQVFLKKRSFRNKKLEEILIFI